jgi:hypothetical protein
MTALSAEKISKLRARQESTFVDTCTLRQPVTIVDPLTKKGSTTWEDAGTVMCGVSSPSTAAATGLPDGVASA